MIRKSELLKVTRQILRRGLGLPVKTQLNPDRDYLIGILVMLLIVLVGALYAMQLFITHSERSGKTAADLGIRTNYDQTTINEAIDLFTDRAATFETLKNNPPSAI